MKTKVNEVPTMATTTTTATSAASLTDALWQRYRGTGDPAARTQLLDRYLGLVHHVARQVAARVSDVVEVDDLVSAGTLGLVQALESFDLSRGLAFSTFAMRRIRGSILDELRSRDWVPRSVRAKGRQLATAVAQLESKLGRSPEPQEVAGVLSLDLETYWRWRDRDQDEDGEESDNEAELTRVHACSWVGAIRCRRRFKAWVRICDTRDSVTCSTSAICRRFSSS
jgi:RNA polymerase sigma factor (sigma-70 family)